MPSILCPLLYFRRSNFDSSILAIKRRPHILQVKLTCLPLCFKIL
ncbi:hypothetical protein AAJ76_2370001964 [Vairimorpha ceranae]|uniref:Uncharacterized protein n=1 Tax=Vairimorpha ceranae TaxID=40302 RepID=A0A0F9W9Y2_9MICR|nr:hypothetical protein AAJ76_2370001964 [Vairimorpha ceranae]KKO73775.1 hypothetical protein AAJ76_2370001964 [Vairimorpha ceranae]